MNYIKQLQAENADLKNQINNIEESINDFRRYANSDKFTGVDLDGSRKDWMAISDIHRYLSLISINIKQ